LKTLCKDLERYRDSRNKKEEDTKCEAKQVTLNSKKYEEELDKAMILLKNFEPTLDEKKRQSKPKKTQLRYRSKKSVILKRN